MTSAHDGSHRLGRVPLGIALAFYGLELTALGFLLTLVTPFVGAGNLDLAMRLIFWVSILLLVASVMSFVGKALCLTMPADMPGKSAVYAAVGLNLLAIAIQAAERFTVLPAPLTQGISLAAIASFVCFLVFLRHLARRLDDATLVRNASDLLRMGIVLVALVALMAVVGTMIPVAGLALGVLALVIGIMVVLRYSRLLLGLKRTLATA